MKKFLILSLVLLLVCSVSAKESSISGIEPIEILIKNQEEFSEDPLGYIKANIDISDYIDFKEYDQDEIFRVTYKSHKGFLKAYYNTKGELGESVQKFQDIMLPFEVRNKLYKSFPGNDLVGVEYVAYANQGKIQKEIFRISFKYEGKFKHTTIRRKLV